LTEVKRTAFQVTKLPLQLKLSDRSVICFANPILTENLKILCIIIFVNIVT
jgi:hypothetical protein